MPCITLRMLYHGFLIITALSETVVEKPQKEAFGIAFLSSTEEHLGKYFNNMKVHKNLFL